jgi:hypothetical protein
MILRRRISKRFRITRRHKGYLRGITKFRRYKGYFRRFNGY